VGEGEGNFTENSANLWMNLILSKLCFGSHACPLYNMCPPVSQVASQVLFSARTCKESDLQHDSHSMPNVKRYPMVQSLTAHGTATLPDGTEIGPVDAIIYCTGYLYCFPFLKDITGEGLPSGDLSVSDQRVGPLYNHIFPPTMAPGLSFLGLPWKVVPFPQVELQAKLVARVLSGQTVLPSMQEMHSHVLESYESLKSEGVHVRFTHMQNHAQWEYNDR
jgi:hypothetical protein